MYDYDKLNDLLEKSYQDENTDGGSWYASVDGKEEIRTSQRIYDNKGNTLLENDVSSYTKEGKGIFGI